RLTRGAAIRGRRAQPQPVVDGRAIAEQHVRRLERRVRWRGWIGIPIHLEAAVEYVVVLGTRAFPGDFVVTEAEAERHGPGVVVLGDECGRVVGSRSAGGPATR